MAINTPPSGDPKGRWQMATAPFETFFGTDACGSVRNDIGQIVGSASGWYWVRVADGERVGAPKGPFDTEQQAEAAACSAAT